MAGLNVHNLMLPYSENIGDETSLKQLDIFLDRASAHDIRVIVTLVQGVSIAKENTHPFYNAGGVEGLIRDTKLKSDYKDLIKRIVTHVNTVNGKPYRDDDTIMAWDLITEPIPSPVVIPNLPDNTMEELGFWVQEMVSYIKSLDHNHLVTMMLTGSVNFYENWPAATKGLDFISIGICVYDVLYIPVQPTQSLGEDYLEIFMNYPVFSIGKPVVAQIDFTSAWLTEEFAKDYELQGQIYKEALEKGFQSGIAGGLIFCWGTKELAEMKGDDLISLYLTYDATSKDIITPIMEMAARLPFPDE